jgi:hypothetical protein
MTRSGVIRLQAGSTVSLVSVYPTLHTYWCGFRLDTLFSPLVAFFAASYTKTMNAGTVTFNNSLINEGGAWNDSASAFTAPVSGIYFFTFSGGVSANKRPLIRLLLNNNTVVATAQFGGGGLIKPSGGPGVDVVSRSILLQLNASDVLQMISPQSANLPLYSDPLQAWPRPYLDFSTIHWMQPSKAATYGFIWLTVKYFLYKLNKRPSQERT